MSSSGGRGASARVHGHEQEAAGGDPPKKGNLFSRLSAFCASHSSVCAATIVALVVALLIQRIRSRGIFGFGPYGRFAAAAPPRAKKGKPRDSEGGAGGGSAPDEAGGTRGPEGAARGDTRADAETERLIAKINGS